MAEVKVTELPPIVLEDFTNNDSFLIVDDGRARRLTKPVFQSWIEENVKGEKGEQGVAGRDGTRGVNGTNGRDGSDGLSAYQIAVQNGFVGSNSEWLDSLKGATAARGDDGDDGWSPVIKATVIGSKSALEIVDWVGGTGEKPEQLGYISESGVVSNIDLALDLRGEKGEQGIQGIQGAQGIQGVQGNQGDMGDMGYSAYDLAVENGFVGTEEEWLLSLNPAEVSKDPNNILQNKIDGMFAPATDPLEMANAIDALEDKNIMSDAQKAKLEALKTSKYLGTYLTSEEIPLEGAEAGNYADVDSGEPNADTERWIYDADSLKFVKSVSIPASETSESVKEKYESNEDTNAFTDLEKDKLESLELETSETIKTKYEENLDTNAFTDAEKSKLEGLEGETEETIKTKYESNLDTNAFTDAYRLKLDSIVVSDTGESEITAETPETIKAKYETNPDTNAFTDLEKGKLESLELETSETIKTKYEENLDTNAFTDLEKGKLESLELETSETVKAKYEGNPDTNAYTDAEKSKLAGLPSEITPETEESIKDKYESNLDTNVFTDAEKSKLSEMTVGSINENGSTPLKFWVGTQEEYDLIIDKDPETLYVIKNSEVSP